MRETRKVRAEKLPPGWRVVIHYRGCERVHPRCKVAMEHVRRLPAATEDTEEK